MSNDSIFELAGAVFPTKRWCHTSAAGLPMSDCGIIFEPRGEHFADVLAWLADHGAVEINTFYVTVTEEYDDIAEIEHDNTAAGIRRAVHEAALRVREAK